MKEQRHIYDAVKQRRTPFTGCWSQFLKRFPRCIRLVGVFSSGFFFLLISSKSFCFVHLNSFLLHFILNASGRLLADLPRPVPLTSSYFSTLQCVWCILYFSFASSWSVYSSKYSVKFLRCLKFSYDVYRKLIFQPKRKHANNLHWSLFRWFLSSVLFFYLRCVFFFFLPCLRSFPCKVYLHLSTLLF